MTLVLPALVVAFVAFCIWLTVRIVNRREKRAKPMLAVVVIVLLPILYGLSIGPAFWLVFHGPSFDSLTPYDVYRATYRPLLFLAEQSEAINQALSWYESLFVPDSYLEQLILSDFNG